MSKPRPDWMFGVRAPLAIPRNRAQGEAPSRFCASLRHAAAQRIHLGGAKRKQREERRHGE